MMLKPLRIFAISIIIFSFSIVMSGCAGADIQTSGKVMQAVDNDDYALLGFFGDLVEVAGGIVEIGEIAKGDYVDGKGYEYFPKQTEEEKKFNIEPDFTYVTDKNYNYYNAEYSSATKKTWLDADLGGSKCKNRQHESCIGDYFQWGRYADGHEDEFSTALEGRPYSAFALVDGASFENYYGKDYRDAWKNSESENNPCPRGYTLPDPFDLYDEIMSNDDFNFAYNGYRSNKDGKIKDVGKYATYWTSHKGYYIKVSEKGAKIIKNDTEYSMGRAVRCVKENY